MKNSIKRMISVLFACLILVSAFAACGGNNGDKDNNKSGTADSSEVTVVPNTPSVEQGSPYENFDPYASMPAEIKGQTVKFCMTTNELEAEGTNVQQTIEDKIGISCEYMHIPRGAYINDMKIQIQAGNIPDVFCSNDQDMAFPLSIEIAAPINLVSTVDLNEPIWNQNLIKTATIDGNIFMVNTIGTPWCGGNMVYYNKTLFAENGFKTPEEYYEEGNWTWDTMIRVMKDVKALGSDYIGGSVDVARMGDSMGVSFVMYDWNTATYSSGIGKRELVTAYQKYADMRAQGLLGGGTDQFIKGKLGIIITGTYGLKATGYFSEMDPNDIGYTYLPSVEGGNEARRSAIHRMYGIVDGAPHANAAGYFLRFFLDPANYDLQSTFITPEAGNFYYGYTNVEAEKMFFNFDDSAAILAGDPGWFNASYNLFRSGAARASSAQVPTEIDAVAGIVDDAVSRCNAIIQKKIADMKNR